MLLTSRLSTPCRLAFFFQLFLTSQATYFKHNFFKVITSFHLTLVLRDESNFQFETTANYQQRLQWKLPSLQAEKKMAGFVTDVSRGSSSQHSFLYLQERTSLSTFSYPSYSLGATEPLPGFCFDQEDTGKVTYSSCTPSTYIQRC